MAITLGTNIPAAVARVNLKNNTNKLTTTLERLSSGTKINRAGDDAAGLVISQNMQATITSSKQAMNNIQNANAFLAVAENGMVSISDHFQRINDLLTNMASDSNDTDSRTAAIREIIERLEEVDRLADSTSFNGRKMLDGGVKDKDGKKAPVPIIIQIGPNDDETESTLDISKALTDCHVSAFGLALPEALTPPEDGKKDENGKFNPDNKACREYMAKVQDAISEIATRRGLLGAYENRMDCAYEALSTRVESLEEAKSIYTDTDIAEEASNLIQKQIMQQIDVSILSNANTIQQMALTLLGG